MARASSSALAEESFSAHLDTRPAQYKRLDAHQLGAAPSLAQLRLVAHRLRDGVARFVEPGLHAHEYLGENADASGNTLDEAAVDDFVDRPSSSWEWPPRPRASHASAAAKNRWIGTQSPIVSFPGWTAAPS